jgi:hypothetical protein
MGYMDWYWQFAMGDEPSARANLRSASLAGTNHHNSTLLNLAVPAE